MIRVIEGVMCDSKIGLVVNNWRVLVESVGSRDKIVLFSLGGVVAGSYVSFDYGLFCWMCSQGLLWMNIVEALELRLVHVQLSQSGDGRAIRWERMAGFNTIVGILGEHKSNCFGLVSDGLNLSVQEGMGLLLDESICYSLYCVLRDVSKGGL